jgi:hypothetical protein
LLCSPNPDATLMIEIWGLDGYSTDFSFCDQGIVVPTKVIVPIIQSRIEKWNHFTV